MFTLSHLSHQQRRVYTRRGLLALAAAGVTTAVAVPMSAEASGYPSWKDVLAARGDVTKKAAEIATLKGLLAKSQAAAEQAQKVAEQRGAEYQTAQGRVDSATQRLQTIEKQVEADDKRAAQAKQRAGQLAAQLSRTGGADVETTLLLSGTDASASDFLARLGRLSKLTESNGAIADEAAAAKNAAAATQAQMQEVKNQLVGLKEQARVAFQAAVQASAPGQRAGAAGAGAAGRAAGPARRAAGDLRLRRSPLPGRRGRPEGGAGRGRWRLRQRRGLGEPGGCRADHRRLRTPPGPARRRQPLPPRHRHRRGYGSPIYAAHAGTVVYAGWFGTYGYWIEIDDGDGIQTGYAHIRPGGIFVRVGQQVSAGQNIASVGQTGAATGPHLHFEVRLNEVAVNAQPFMAARGIILGG